MLRLSKKADYALIALKDLAAADIGASSSAREIAERYNVPVELMAKVLQKLAKVGLVASHHGTRGGYQLARPAMQISVAGSRSGYRRSSIHNSLFPTSTRLAISIPSATSVIHCGG